jgi:hypothetical protein
VQHTVLEKMLILKNPNSSNVPRAPKIWEKNLPKKCFQLATYSVFSSAGLEGLLFCAFLTILCYTY